MKAFASPKTLAGGLCAGLVNGLLGSGGGMIAVPTLEHAGLEPRRAHSGSLAVILPICFISASLYLSDGRVAISDALPYLPGGVIGAFIGAFIIRRISPVWLRRIFGGFALWAGLRLIMQRL